MYLQSSNQCCSSQLHLYFHLSSDPSGSHKYSRIDYICFTHFLNFCIQICMTCCKNHLFLKLLFLRFTLRLNPCLMKWVKLSHIPLRRWLFRKAVFPIWKEFNEWKREWRKRFIGFARLVLLHSLYVWKKWRRWKQTYGFLFGFHPSKESISDWVLSCFLRWRSWQTIPWIPLLFDPSLRMLFKFKRCPGWYSL